MLIDERFARGNPSASVKLGRALRHYRWVVGSKARRVARAWRYAIGRSTLTDAYDIDIDCREVTGLYPLVSMSVDNVLELAEDRWGDFPELKAYAESAVRRVYDRWSSPGHELEGAEGWAMDLIEEWAKEDGLELEDGYGVDSSELENVGAIAGDDE